MLFEFFRKLFGRADEGQSRKRKATELNPVSNKENYSSPKKYCSDRHTMQQPRIIDETSIDKFSAFGSRNTKVSVLRPSQFDNNSCGTRQATSFLQRNTNSSDHNHHRSSNVYCPKHKSLNQSTLFQTYKLTTRKQYENVLHNYTFSTTLPTPEQIETRRIKQKLYPTKIQTLSKDDITPSIGQILDKTLKISSQGPLFSLSKPTRIQTQSKVVDVVELKDDDDDDEDDDSEAEETPKYYTPQVPHVNSMKQKFAPKAVVKRDFMDIISRKYKYAEEQKLREAEELKKMTLILSRKNQLSREVKLEDELNKSMKIWEEYSEDDYLLDEEPKLPELTDEMLAKVRSALCPRPPEQILVQEFGLRITRKDMQTLANLNWLNDEVINFYMNLLIKRSELDNYPDVYAMNTFFYPKLLSGGHASLKRWTRKVDIFGKDLVVVPVHLGVHWCMSVIDMRNKCIKYFDSMGSPNNKCLQVLRQYLADECLDKKKSVFDFTGWSFENVRDIPQQTNGSDCGVFSCVFAEHVCANRDFEFAQDDMPYFRNKMVYEILTAQLL